MVSPLYSPLGPAGWAPHITELPRLEETTLALRAKTKVTFGAENTGEEKGHWPPRLHRLSFRVRSEAWVQAHGSTQS